MIIDFNDSQLTDSLNTLDGYLEKYTIGLGDYSELMGDDEVYGPNNIENDSSIIGRLVDGDDYLQIYNGLFNDMNTNRGNDTIALFGGGGRVLAGRDDDYIEITGGQWEEVNGNKGNDYISNRSEFGGTIRGGQGDDVIINSGGGYFYGDQGADKFIPYALNEFGGYSDVMIIEDFELFTDTLDLSALGNGVYTINAAGNTLVSVLYPDGFDQLVAVVKGVYL